MKHIFFLFVFSSCIFVSHAQLKGDTTGTYYDSKLLTTAAVYKKGNADWKKYLEFNLDKDIASINKAPIGKYTPGVEFIVNEKGEIVYAKVIKDPGYGTAEELLKWIWKSSSQWKTATMNGLPVKCLLKQYTTFFVH